jgi:F-type H+-transporting ATPase subunit a
MHISTTPEVLFYLGPIPVSNSMLTSWIAALLLIAAGVLVGKSFKRLPSGLQHVFEIVYEMFENLAGDALGKAGKTFVPFAVTLFLLILVNNWLGILPGVGSLGIYRAAEPAVVGGSETSSEQNAAAGEGTSGEHELEFVPLFRGGNADLNMTFALATIAMVTVHVVGVRSSGLKVHLSHFKNPLEIISELTKVLSFSFRLFGNVFAGEVLLAAMIGILAIITGNQLTIYGLVGGVVAVPFVVFELFVGFIQAFVFAVLTLSFIALFYNAGHH